MRWGRERQTGSGVEKVRSGVEAEGGDAARAELVGRGVEASELFHFAETGQIPGPDPERRSYNTFLSFNDPDGNTWLVQEVKRA